MNELQRYIQEVKPENDKWVELAKPWRANFIRDFPKDKIEDMTMEEFLFSKKNYGNPKSFCCRLWNNAVCSLGNSFPSLFGIYYANGTELNLSPTFSNMCADKEEAFAYIKKEISRVIVAGEGKNLKAIENSSLNNSFKCLILITYFEYDYFPAPTKTALDAYCQAVQMPFDPKENPIYRNARLVQWMKKVPEMSEWTPHQDMMFCDWLWRQNLVFKVTDK